MRPTSYVAALKRKHAMRDLLSELAEFGLTTLRAVCIGAFGSLAITLFLYCLGATGS